MKSVVLDQLDFVGSKTSNRHRYPVLVLALLLHVVGRPVGPDILVHPEKLAQRGPGNATGALSPEGAGSSQVRWSRPALSVTAAIIAGKARRGAASESR
jgi:hypothetical protein